MGIRAYLKSLGGRAGNKTRSRGRVNTKKNKRAASKAVRKIYADWREFNEGIIKDRF